MVKFPNIASLQIIGAQCKEPWNDQIPNDSFCKLEFLCAEHCYNLQRVAPSHIWKRLQRRLEILQVKSCPSVKIIYEGDEMATKRGKLRRLVLRDLQNLSHICQSDGLPNVPLPNLRFMEVQSCPHLKMLFPTFMRKFLEQIQELVVESCEDMELVATHEECEEVTSTAISFTGDAALSA
ncbi:uncharacterized protein LOC115729675 [Rhodamnia argentea]|uniref:Uncharacterized protein LOC115729675 n=1 Tax=Rhodamnia argentea TaxID=178133 RepID=A0A8B8N174_9MYRT|nr:uncharacterized protein LOC115729675 [Rhodamnia argentea]